jgi:hypothetical protein
LRGDSSPVDGNIIFKRQCVVLRARYVCLRNPGCSNRGSLGFCTSGCSSSVLFSPNTVQHARWPPIHSFPFTTPFPNGSLYSVQLSA